MSTQEQNQQLVKTNKNTTRVLGFHKRPETHTFYVLISRVLDLVFKARIYLFILFIYLIKFENDFYLFIYLIKFENE